jgi:hypothetical protein
MLIDQLSGYAKLELTDAGSNGIVKLFVTNGLLY